MTEDKEDTTDALPVLGQAGKDKRRAKPVLLVISGQSTVGRFFVVQESPLVLGRSVSADFWVDDEGASRQHAQVKAQGELVVLRDMGSRNGTFRNGARISECVLADGDKIQLGSTILKFTYLDAEEEQLQKNLYEAATRDGATGLHNRRYFCEVLAKDFARALRHSVPLSLLMMDLDHFKQVNDTYGHAAGDRVLTRVANLLQDAFRAEDLTARYGGEEFAVVLKECTAANALPTAERVRTSVAAAKVDLGNGKLIQVTCSIGFSSMPDAGCKDVDQFIQEADRSLYQAKSAGRNRVVGPGMPP